MIDKLSPERLDYNNAAWYALFTNKDYGRALEQARKASEKMDASALHTLAALYAETGKSIEARDALFRSMSRRGFPIRPASTGTSWGASRRTTASATRRWRPTRRPPISTKTTRR